MTDLSTIKTVAEVAAPLTGAIVDTWLRPKLATFFKHQKVDRALIEEAFVSKFDEYLQRSLERQSYITTIVFQNQPRKLDDLYIPLTIESTNHRDAIKLDSFRSELLSGGSRILITDTAGMGKSTALRFLFLSAIRQNVGIPIFVELRQLSTERSVLDIMLRDMAAVDEPVDKDFILKLLRRGDFIFFLDGYDEISYEHRDAVTTELQQFISKAPKNRFLLSSRPEIPLTSFAAFRAYSIKPLTKPEAYALIRRYDAGGSVAERIIEKLDEPSSDAIDHFLTNPLLVSLLYRSYQYKPIVPLRKDIFYRQVYDSLFEQHDLTKGGAFVREKRSKLDIEAFPSRLAGAGLPDRHTRRGAVQ